MPSLGDHLALTTLRVTLSVVGVGGPCGEISRERVADELRRLRDTPAPLVRPTVILSGYHAPHQVAWWARAQLAAVTSGRSEDFLVVSYPLETRIERAADTVLRKVTQRWGERPPAVDIIGLSMGGIVARVAALPATYRSHPLRRTSAVTTPLPIARLFTFATPHQGSIRAQRVAPDAAAKDLMPGAPFLQALDRHDRAYELVCYAQHGDNLIAPAHAAPPGLVPFIAERSRLLSHFTTAHNPWFLVDLARRLRGEPPFLPQG